MAMHLTQYIPLVSLGKSFGSYLGGICNFWYTPIQNLNGFPVINPATQFLQSEPALKAGTNWYGPINVPNNELGFEQQSAKSNAGTFYKQKISLQIPGFDTYTHTNLDNTMPHQLCVVAKLRSGGYFIILGNDAVGLDVDINETTGIGAANTPVSKLVLSTESTTRAMVLPSFAGTNSQPPFIIPTATPMANITETIDFNTTGDTYIAWTLLRQTNFGIYPTMQLWAKNADGSFSEGHMPIDTQGSPITHYIVRNAGGEGKIKLS